LKIKLYSHFVSSIKLRSVMLDRNVSITSYLCTGIFVTVTKVVGLQVKLYPLLAELYSKV
jgi:hypothetical protein